MTATLFNIPAGVRRHRPKSTGMQAIVVVAGLVLGLVGGLVLVAAAPSGGASAAIAQTDLTGPPGSKFGTSVTVLPNGNYVVTDPYFDQGNDLDVGAVHLYNGFTHTPISTLTGQAAGDEIGSGGVIVLANGNYVVKSPYWGANGTLGAVTWGNASSGVSGTVSTANSLHGTVANDQVGWSGVRALTNGNYVVMSPHWGTTDVGAVTWANGTTGLSGPVTTDNSLHGTAANDQVGGSGVTALTNGNYVVSSSNWLGQSGAVTWGNGAVGVRGAVTTDNSLYGSGFGYGIGSGGATALTNGNYVAVSAFVSNIGAVTWGNGASGSAGPVNIFNSLLGSTADDLVGSGGVTALSNGNYAVSSPNWYNPAAGAHSGAVTFGNGATGISGAVGIANSLHGTYANDTVGSGGVTALTNGNYVVSSPNLDSATTANVGAVTWCNGATGRTGQVNHLNSLHGTDPDDSVGVSGATALTNGNYVVSSPLWGLADVGAVTWADGATGIIGPVTIDNSLHGTAGSDRVGLGGVDPVTALTNGNYVVGSKGWDNGPIANVGAVTWGNGATGISGPVSIDNSLYGSTAGDNVGFGGMTALTNGNFVVTSPFWDNAAHDAAGAVTWGDGASGLVGPVSTANSLYGTSDQDQIGAGLPADEFGFYGVTALADGNYAVSSPNWDNGTTGVNAGAVTWRAGTSGSGAAVSVSNSAVGTSPGLVGRTARASSASGAYVVATSQNRVLLISVVPGAPTGLTAVVGDRQVSLGWVTPTDTGRSSVTGYRIESSVDGVVWTVAVDDTGSAQASRVVTGLTNGTPYRFRVSARNMSGVGASSAVAGPVVPTALYVAVVPARLMESRSGPGLVTVDGLFQAGGAIAAGGTVELPVGGRGGVPAGAAAAVLNVTAVNPQGPGYLTVWPCGETRPNASSVNYVPGQTVPNAVITKIGFGDTVCIFTQSATDLVIDVNGYFPN